MTHSGSFNMNRYILTHSHDAIYLWCTDCPGIEETDYIHSYYGNPDRFADIFHDAFRHDSHHKET